MTLDQKLRNMLLLGALVFAAAMAVYSWAVPRELLWDDHIFIQRNGYVRDCSNLGAALRPGNLFYVQPVPMSARPVVNASLILDVCSGGGIQALHYTNSLLHAFNAVLLFAFILLLLDEPAAAFFGALVFAVHPAAAELVHIASFRSHLIGTFFFLGGMLAALSHIRKGGIISGSLAAAFYLLAMLSVETPVVFPLAALALAWFAGGRPAVKRLLPLLAVLAALAVFYLWFRAPRSGYTIAGVSQAGLAGTSPFYPRPVKPADGPRLEYYTVIPWRLVYRDHMANFYTMARVLAGYLLALPLPLRLAIEHNPPVITSLYKAFLPLCADLAVLAAAALLFIRRRFEGLGLALALILFLPVMNIWPTLNIEADRYLYMPLAGFALAAAALYSRFRPAAARARVYKVLAAGLFAAALALAALLRNPDFADRSTLYTASSQAEPAAFGVRLNLAAIAQARKDCAGVFRQVDAVKGVDPGNILLKRHVGTLLAACGRREEALADMAEVLKVLPNDPEALYWTKALNRGR